MSASGAEESPSSADAALARLAALLREQGGLMATLVRAGGAPGVPGGPAQIAAGGPRASGEEVEYELLVEAIYEGYLLHYGEPRVLQVADADLRVLAGDRMYAVGLARLVALGDTIAVGEIADTITLSALAHGAGAVELARAVWAAGARAIGWGASRAHDEAKRLVLVGAAEAFEAMRTSALVPAKPR